MPKSSNGICTLYVHPGRLTWNLPNWKDKSSSKTSFLGSIFIFGSVAATMSPTRRENPLGWSHIRDVKAHYNFPVRFPVWRCAEAQRMLEFPTAVNKNNKLPTNFEEIPGKYIQRYKFHNSKEEQKTDMFLWFVVFGPRNGGVGVGGGKFLPAKSVIPPLKLGEELHDDLFFTNFDVKIGRPSLGRVGLWLFERHWMNQNKQSKNPIRPKWWHSTEQVCTLCIICILLDIFAYCSDEWWAYRPQNSWVAWLMTIMVQMVSVAFWKQEEPRLGWSRWCLQTCSFWMEYDGIFPTFDEQWDFM